MSVWWSVGLAAGSVWGTWLVGNRNKAGWLVGVTLQLAWVVYAVLGEQWGFLASCAVFAVVNTRNYLRWRAHDRELDREAARVSA